MERRAVNLSFQRSEEYEFGAALLPQEKSEVRLGDLHASICARALWVRHLAHPDDTTAITAKPQYIFRDTQGIERHVKFVSKRLAEIFVAGRMMIPFLKRATMGEEANLPSDVTILSINRIAAFVLDDAEQSDVSNVKTRYWAPSRSVIHLAVVALIVAQEFKRKQAPLSFDDLLLRRDLIERIVQDGRISNPSWRRIRKRPSGLGLCLSGMIDPRKVLAFLDLAGDWDPSLALVMGGAVTVALPMAHLTLP